MRSPFYFPFLLPFIFLVCLCLGADNVSPIEVVTDQATRLELTKAVMCERIEDYAPVNMSVVFSVTVGKISCFTTFDSVAKEMQIEHRWFYKDRLTTRKRLFLKPPRWSTYSSIQLRDADKGPWRVEIADNSNRLLGTLRFSVTD